MGNSYKRNVSMIKNVEAGVDDVETVIGNLG